MVPAATGKGFTVKVAVFEVVGQGDAELTITSNTAPFSEIFGLLTVRTAVLTPE